ncbi:GNAT family N-acetyltransferase [Pseudoalteromonas piratica]|uniref:Acetyltransferase n=1 Tax=Pseudoalteromonas piratica TaxID=1348114 RepID=A0A0A7EMZ9_9GAMM|nr:GNAT family N-acetyltransferase [Pseudoalteromonas piratica]AIY67352.1 acetyltransferase [Pseudoalteromonas piratica]
MITIEKLMPQYLEGLKQVALAEAQVQFACSASDFLKECNANVHLYVVVMDSKVVGFFKLDCDYSKTHAFCPSDGVGLRSFVIDQKQQGKGIGQSALQSLISYLKQEYKTYNWLYLTVNCKNALAKKCYQKAGFIEQEQLYLAGPAGPQHIMYYPL